MSQSKKRRTAKRSLEKEPGSKTIDSTPKWRGTGFIITSVVLAIILIIVGVFYYQERVAPFQTTIITVDNTTTNIGYFLKRAQLAGADSISMLHTLTNELLIKLEAPQYVGEVSSEDINQTLRDTSNTTSESEFKAWYRQTLNESGLSDSEFRDIVATSILSARLQQYLAERVPTVAEQIHLHVILLATLEDAENTRARWEAGEDFADLAREVSTDSSSKEKGGDLGWFPRGVLPKGLENAAFALSTDNVSEPIAYDVTDPNASNSSSTTIYYLFMVSEKADARKIDENSLQVLRNGALDNWLLAEIQVHKVQWHGLYSENFDSETNAWLSWQLAKNQPSSTQTSSGTTSGGQ